MTAEGEQPSVTPRTDGRDQKGRFSTGNACAKGNPTLREIAAMRRELREAATTLDLREVLLALHVRATSTGDPHAANVLLTHLVGRPREAPAGSVELPDDLSTASGIEAGLVRIAHAAASGEIPAADGERLAGLLGRVADAAVLRDLEERLAAVEQRKKR